ncbi:MAG: 50S ribosomal protein L19 [Candidatus Babeliales bacterium]
MVELKKKYTKQTINQIGVVDRNFPDFRAGDELSVVQKVQEGKKERKQLFEGRVIKIHRNGASSTFTVRKIGAHGIGVERIYPFSSMKIVEITVKERGKVRRAKLFYLRKLKGRHAKIKSLRSSRVKTSVVAE